MDLMHCLTADAHTLEDSEIPALLKFFIKECDRRFIDYQDVIEEAEQEIEAEFDEECANAVPDYACTDIQGW